MKRLKALFIAIAAICAMGSSANTANSETIGYVNYKTVESSYEYAKQAYKEIVILQIDHRRI